MVKPAHEMTDNELATVIIGALSSADANGRYEQARLFIEENSGVRMSPNEIETAASYLRHCVEQEVFLRTARAEDVHPGELPPILR